MASNPLGVLAGLLPGFNGGNSSHPPGSMAQPESDDATGGFDSVANGMKNLYGAGGPGDALINIGMGLLLRRGVGPGLAQATL